MTVENAEVFAMEIEDIEITVAESMEFGAPLAFEHWRSTLRGPHTEGVSREGRHFVRFADIINVKNAPSG